MNYRYGLTANAALALAVGLALAYPGSAALAIGEPIPGIDIVVKKNPGPIIVIVNPVNDAPGRFSVQLKEPGNYTISTACRLPAGCLPHTLSGALKPGGDGEPSIIAILVGLLLPAQKASAGGTSFNFTVGDRGVVLNGQFQDSAGVRVAAGDVTGDGVETRKAAPKKAAVVKPGIAESNSALSQVSTTRGTAPRPDGGDVKDEKPQSMVDGCPCQGTPIGLEGDPEGVTVSTTTTDENGAYQFTKLPAGKYKLIIAGLRAKSVSVGPDGTIIGKLMRNSDGTMGFDAGSSKAAAPIVYGQPVIFTASGRITPIAVDPTDATPGISDQGVAGNLSTYSTAPPPKDGTLPSKKAGDPIPGVPIGLEGDPGSIKVSTTTDKNGAYEFTKLPAGKYKLTLAGLPSKSATVGAGGTGTISGKVMRNSDGTMGFDTGSSKAAGNPVAGFGSGMGAGPGVGAGMGPGGMGPGGMSPGGAMGPGGPMSPGGAMGGPGGAMGGPKR